MGNSAYEIRVLQHDICRLSPVSKDVPPFRRSMITNEADIFVIIGEHIFIDLTQNVNESLNSYRLN